MAELNTQLDNLDDEDFEQSFESIVDNAENSVDEVEVSDNSQSDTEDSFEESEEEDIEYSEETDDLDDEDEDETESEDLDDIEESEELEVEEESPEDTDEVSEDTDSSEELDYKASYNAIMAPLKVSGKEVKVRSVDDLRNLAQMGMDYSHKMRDIKPLRAIGETLTQAGIIIDGQVDEARLMRLVDISKGNKEAIAQLLVEQGIDPLDDIETENIQYTPSRMVTNESLDIQEIERELVNRGSVNNVIAELSKLDVQSKQFFEKSPANLLKLDDDIKSGVYQEVMATVQYERSVGRLRGVSDIDAYIQLVSQSSAPAPAPQRAPQVQAKPKATAERKKAAGITKRAPVKQTVKQKYDFINMSDEEFEKLIPTSSLY